MTKRVIELIWGELGITRTANEVLQTLIQEYGEKAIEQHKEHIKKLNGEIT